MKRKACLENWARTARRSRSSAVGSHSARYACAAASSSSDISRPTFARLITSSGPATAAAKVARAHLATSSGGASGSGGGGGWCGLPLFKRAQQPDARLDLRLNLTLCLLTGTRLPIKMFQKVGIGDARVVTGNARQPAQRAAMHNSPLQSDSGCVKVQDTRLLRAGYEDDAAAAPR